MHPTATATEQLTCYHCGEDCSSNTIRQAEKMFCCEGCKMVYQLLDQNGLCEYYNLNDRPGVNLKKPVRQDKFSFLEDASIQQKLISFHNDEQVHASFYLPQIHCSSCLYLLEHLHQLDEAVISSKINFTSKEIQVVYHPQKTNLRKVAELLTSVGYEPYISLNDLGGRKPGIKRSLIYQLGVAGFCFANIMLLSFPEYLGLEASEKQLQIAFRTIGFLLSLPVFFYSAQPFYVSGWKGLKHRYLNIDAPIALAVSVTFVRSVYVVTSGTGSGYFDSMTGIVFFMLVGRVLQDKTYQQLSFERDYTSYFPIAVTVLKDGQETPTTLPNIKAGDTLLIHNEELIPADGILTRGKALIDYSFVTGESIPVNKEMGEIVYAGGKQTGSSIELLVIKEVAQSYLTRLWSGDQFKKDREEKGKSFVDLLSRYFTFILFSITALAALYWWQKDASQIWHVITSVLIVACPCALMLSNTFTNGNILRIFGRNQFYLRNAQTIENMAGVNHIVFDKTGTLTTTKQQDLRWEGRSLDAQEENALYSLAAQSNHPLSKALVNHYRNQYAPMKVEGFVELIGKGVQGCVESKEIALGSKSFITGQNSKYDEGSQVWVSVNGEVTGYFLVRNVYRAYIPDLIGKLSKKYAISVLSGDNAGDRPLLSRMLGPQVALHFNQQPADKLHYIQQLQKEGKRVMMIGDGLNDAGALKQSDVGVALTEDSNNFTPASDAILDAGQVPRFIKFLQLAKANKRIVMAAFILSILYNIIGIGFAVQGLLSPMVAAILMPISSLSIVLVTFGSSNLLARWMKL